jgi:transposase
MRAGRITKLEDARQYLQQHWDIYYASVNGVWYMLRQRRVKCKTGRRRHRPANTVAQSAFKKTSDAY